MLINNHVLRTPIILILGMTIGFLKCAPVFSDLQGAGLVGKGRYEITPGFSSVSFSNDDESEHIQNHYGVQVGYGMSDRADIRFRLERIQLDTNGGDPAGATVLGIGPKFGKRHGTVALYLPVGMAFGEDVDEDETIEFHPTVLTTIPISDVLKINPSIKALVPLNRDNADVLVALNLGMALGDPDKFAVRPEIGFLYNPGEEGHYTHFSVGLSFRTID
jgi:hypothetical protein